jgi:hypothetical protein
MLEGVEIGPLVLLDCPGFGSSTERPGVRRWRVPKTPSVLPYPEIADGVHDRSDWRSGRLAP